MADAPNVSMPPPLLVIAAVTLVAGCLPVTVASMIGWTAWLVCRRRTGASKHTVAQLPLANQIF
jgi:hypothetical protein